MLGAVADFALLQGDRVLAGEGVDPAREIAGHGPQPGLGDFFSRAQFVPPRQQAAAGLAQGKIAAHHHAVSAIVTAAEQLRDVA